MHQIDFVTTETKKFACVPLETKTSSGILEYCKWETFNATCEPGSVVLMQSAKYGRMRQGRCASTDVFIGCSADVLSQMDSRCSGRETCSIVIPDATLHQQQPCPNDIMAYLEASFTCVPGSLHICCLRVIVMHSSNKPCAALASSFTILYRSKYAVTRLFVE